MYSVLLFAIATALVFLADVESQKYWNTSASHRGWIAENDLQSLRNALDGYRKEHSSYPSSEAEITSAPGYEFTKSKFQRIGYAVSGPILGGEFFFQRSAFYSTTIDQKIGGEEFLGKNSCGSGDFFDAASWCGTNEIKWVRLETRERFDREFARNSERISRLANKFIEYRNSSNDFPKKLRDGGLLGAGERVKISDLIGYVGAAHGCSGVFFYESIPLDCTDIFNEWGSDNFYEYVDTKKIIFSSESRVLNGSGEPIVFIREFSN